MFQLQLDAKMFLLLTPSTTSVLTFTLVFSTLLRCLCTQRLISNNNNNFCWFFSDGGRGFVLERDTSSGSERRQGGRHPQRGTQRRLLLRARPSLTTQVSIRSFDTVLKNCHLSTVGWKWRTLENCELSILNGNSKCLLVRYSFILVSQILFFWQPGKNNKLTQE